MPYRREGNESSCVHASDPLLETERSKIVVKYKCSLCRQVMAVREALHAECGQLLCSKCVTRATRNGQANPVGNYQPLQHQETQEPGFSIEEQEPQQRMQGGGAYGGTSWTFLPIGGEETEGHNILHQLESGHQTSGMNGSFEGSVRDAGQETTLRSLSMRFRGSEDYPLRGMSAPDTEEGLDVDQQDRRRGLPIGAIQLKQKEHATEHYCDTLGTELWLRRFDEAMMSQLEGRFCFGTYHWKIQSFEKRRVDAITGAMVAQLSPPICNRLYGYNFCMMMYPNGVNSGVGSHVAIYVHMIQGENDDRLQWPFTGVITLSILDRSGSETPNDITKVLTASPNLAAFRKPTAIWNSIGCGFERFAPIYEVLQPRFLKNDTLIVKMEISLR